MRSSSYLARVFVAAATALAIFPAKASEKQPLELPTCITQGGYLPYHARIGKESLLDAYLATPSHESVMAALNTAEQGICKKFYEGAELHESRCLSDELKATRQLAIYVSHFLEISHRNNKIAYASKQQAEEGYAYLQCQIGNLNELIRELDNGNDGAKNIALAQELFVKVKSKAVFGLKLIRATIAGEAEDIDLQKIAWYLGLGFDPAKMDQVIDQTDFLIDRNADAFLPDLFPD